MKKILLSITMIALGLLVYAQNLSLSTEGSALEPNAVITLTGNPDDSEIFSEIAVTNNSTQNLNVKVKKIISYAVENTMNTFCWGMCFAPNVYVSPDPILIHAGETNQHDFSCHYYPSSQAGMTSIKYVIFNDDNPADSVMVSVNFDARYAASNFSLSHNGGNPVEPNSVVAIQGFASDETMVAHFNVTNNSASALDVKVRKIENRLITNTVNVFCWGGTCFDPSTYVSPIAFNIAAGATTTDADFWGEYSPMGNAGESMITYIFFDNNNPADYVSVVAKYDASGTGTTSFTGPEPVINVFPNPANSTANFEYNLNGYIGQAKVQIVNLLGNVVKESPLDGQKGHVKINTLQLEEGLYFYVLLVNGIPAQTSKLIIRH